MPMGLTCCPQLCIVSGLLSRHSVFPLNFKRFVKVFPVMRMKSFTVKRCHVTIFETKNTSINSILLIHILCTKIFLNLWTWYLTAVPGRLWADFYNFCFFGAILPTCSTVPNFHIGCAGVMELVGPKIKCSTVLHCNKYVSKKHVWVNVLYSTIYYTCFRLFKTFSKTFLTVTA